MATELKHLDAHIRVKNVERAAEWYRRMLGMKVEMAVPDRKAPTFVRLVTPGGAAVMISDGGDFVKGKPAPKPTAAAIAARKAHRVVSLYFHVDDGIESLFRSVKRKGAKITQELGEQPYGMKEFAIQDPDGYTVAVGQVSAGATGG